MTEVEWLACTEPEKMLNFLRDKVSDRKLRLFACACCRRHRSVLRGEKNRRVLEAAEDFADGEISRKEMEQITNGPTRKTLASQLDRLDGILDALSDGLNEAVASAVKEATGAAVQEAVRQALIEVLTNPDVLTLMSSAARAHVADPAPENMNASGTDRRSGLRERVNTLGAWAGGRVRAARSVCVNAAAVGRRCLGGLSARLAPLWRLRKHLLLALGLGAAVGVIAYAAGPWLSAVISGVATAASTLCVQARLWLQRLMADTAFGSSTS